MNLMFLAMLSLAQLTPSSAVHASAELPPAAVIAQADAPAAPATQSVEEAPKPDKPLDINVTVGEPRPTRWYAQPIWIAVFVVGGMAFLTLLAMVVRGSGSTGGTIVKG